MKPSPSKGAKAEGSAQGSTPPTSPPRPNPNKECKKSKTKTEDLLMLVNSGFLQEKEMDMWRAAAGDPYPMEKNPDEVPTFARFVERGLALPASDFFKGLHNLNPNGIFTSSCLSTSVKPSWGSNPTRSCSGSFSV
jgi:hypothetical protein